MYLTLPTFEKKNESPIIFPKDTVLLSLAFFLSLQTTAKTCDPLPYLEGSYADSGPWLETMLFRRKRFKTEVLKETGLS